MTPVPTSLIRAVLDAHQPSASNPRRQVCKCDDTSRMRADHRQHQAEAVADAIAAYRPDTSKVATEWAMLYPDGTATRTPIRTENPRIAQAWSQQFAVGLGWKLNYRITHSGPWIPAPTIIPAPQDPQPKDT